METMTLADLVIRLKADVTKANSDLASVTDRLRQVGSAIQGLGAYQALRVVTGSIKGLVDAASQGQQDMRLLNGALQATGQFGGAERIKDLASALQQVTTFGDEATMGAAAMLAKFQLTETQIISLMPKVQDLAAFMGRDLASSADAVGKAVANGSQGLRGLGLAFSEAERKAFDNATQSERVALIMAKLDTSVKGAARTVAATASGAMLQFTNATGDLGEALGNIIDAPVALVFDVMKDAVVGLTSALEAIPETLKDILGYIGLALTSFASFKIAVFAAEMGLKALGATNATIHVLETTLAGVAKKAALLAAPIIGIAGGLVVIKGAANLLGDENATVDGFGDAIKKSWQSGLSDVKSLLGMGDDNDNALDFSGEAGQLPDVPLPGARGPVEALDFGANGDARSISEIMDEEMQAWVLDFKEDQAPEGTFADLNAGMQGRAPTISMAEMERQAQERITVGQQVEAGMISLGQQLLAGAGEFGGMLSNFTQSMIAGDVTGALATLAAGLISRTEGFAQITEALTGVLTQTVEALNPIMRVVSALLVPMLDAVAMIMGELAYAINWVIEAIDSIPGVDLELDDPAADSVDMMERLAERGNEAAESMKAVSDASANIADGFKYDKRLYEAAAADGALPGSGAPGAEAMGRQHVVNYYIAGGINASNLVELHRQLQEAAAREGYIATGNPQLDNWRGFWGS